MNIVSCRGTEMIINLEFCLYRDIT